MATSEEDFARIGLTADDWKAFILGRGTIDAQRLESARAAVARLGRYSPEQADDHRLTDFALRQIATRYPHLWLYGETLSHEDKVAFLRAQNDWSRDEAERRLEQVRKDREDEARIFGGKNG